MKNEAVSGRQLTLTLCHPENAVKNLFFRSYKERSPFDKFRITVWQTRLYLDTASSNTYI